MKEVLADIWGIAQPGEMQVRAPAHGLVLLPRRPLSSSLHGLRAGGGPLLLHIIGHPCDSPATLRRPSPAPLCHPPNLSPQALLGPSGAGKSTFMDILAMRKSVGNLSGRLLVNGCRAGKRFIRKTAYVPQEDNFVPTMTTWEVMSFYAEVRGRWGDEGEVRGR